LLIGYGGEVALKGRYLHITVAVRCPFDSTVAYLHITIPVWVRCESILLTHYSCCWWPHWKQGTYTLKLLPVPFWKQGTCT